MFGSSLRETLNSNFICLAQRAEATCTRCEETLRKVARNVCNSTRSQTRSSSWSSCPIPPNSSDSLMKFVQTAAGSMWSISNEAADAAAPDIPRSSSADCLQPLDDYDHSPARMSGFELMAFWLCCRPRWGCMGIQGCDGMASAIRAHWRGQTA